MLEELVPSKGETMSICQVGFLNADDVHSLPFQVGTPVAQVSSFEAPQHSTVRRQAEQLTFPDD